MPAVLAAPWLGTAIAGVAGGTAAVVGAKMQSGAAHDAADAQTKAAADTLAYQREQQAQQQKQFEQTQHSNYDQWAADEQNQYGMSVAGAQNDRNMALSAGHNNYAQYKARDQRVGKLGELLGMAPRVTPDFEDPAPLVTPDLKIPPYAGSSGGPVPSGASSLAPTSNDPLAWADRLSSADKAKVDALLKASNSSDDPRYWYGVNAQHGGFDATGADWNQRRISTGDGVGKGYRGTAADMLGAH